MAPRTLTGRVMATKAMLDATVGYLALENEWSVQTFAVPDITAITRWLASAQAPAAVVCYVGSKWWPQDLERRQARIAVVAKMAAANDTKEGIDAVLDQIDAIVLAVDGQQSGGTTWRAESDDVLPSRDGSVNALISFTVWDT